MSYTRREFGKLALAGVPAAAMAGGSGALLRAFVQSKPNSLIDGVQIGTITYSYRSMPDQSAEATLKYVVDSGISAIELMGEPVESFAGAPTGGGRGGGGRGPGGERGARAGGPPADTPPPQMSGTWNGQPCALPGEGGGGRGGGGGGRGRGRGQATPEQQAAQQEQANKLKAWRTSVSMDAFKKLREMYNDAGVTIYAWKVLDPAMSDAEFEYVFDVADALGCTHTTLELLTDAAQLKRIGQFAEKRKIYAAYHTHTQATMTAFDEAFALSKANLSNIDLGHYVAGTGESPIPFLRKFHGRIASVHLKDRTTPAHGAKNLPWGTGDTPLTEILQLMKREHYTFPASIELEYDVPPGSDAVKEVTACLEFCKHALA